MAYIEGTDIQEYIKLLRTRRAAVDNLSTQSMTDETWRGIIIRSIPASPKWLPIIPSLYTMSSSDLISTLFAHGMILERGKPSSGSSNTALAVRTSDGCTNPNCKAKKRSTHTTANCYWPGGGKEGQFPPNFGQRMKANAASVPTSTEGHFILSASTGIDSGNSGVILDGPDDVSNDFGIVLGNSGVILNEPDEDRPSTAFVSNDFKAFQMEGCLPSSTLEQVTPCLYPAMILSNIHQ